MVVGGGMVMLVWVHKCAGMGGGMGGDMGACWCGGVGVVVWMVVWGWHGEMEEYGWWYGCGDMGVVVWMLRDGMRVVV